MKCLLGHLFDPNKIYSTENYASTLCVRCEKVFKVKYGWLLTLYGRFANHSKESQEEK